MYKIILFLSLFFQHVALTPSADRAEWLRKSMATPTDIEEERSNRHSLENLKRCTYADRVEERRSFAGRGYALPKPRPSVEQEAKVPATPRAPFVSDASSGLPPVFTARMNRASSMPRPTDRTVLDEESMRAKMLRMMPDRASVAGMMLKAQREVRLQDLDIQEPRVFAVPQGFMDRHHSNQLSNALMEKKDEAIYVPKASRSRPAFVYIPHMHGRPSRLYFPSEEEISQLSIDYSSPRAIHFPGQVDRSYTRLNFLPEATFTAGAAGAASSAAIAGTAAGEAGAALAALAPHVAAAAATGICFGYVVRGVQELFTPKSEKILRAADKARRNAEYQQEMQEIRKSLTQEAEARAQSGQGNFVEENDFIAQMREESSRNYKNNLKQAKQEKKDAKQNKKNGSGNKNDDDDDGDKTQSVVKKATQVKLMEKGEETIVEFEGVSKHLSFPWSRGSLSPKNPIETLQRSLEVPGNPSRVAVEGKNIIVFRETSSRRIGGMLYKTVHAYVEKQITRFPSGHKVLREAGLVDKYGDVI